MNKKNNNLISDQEEKFLMELSESDEWVPVGPIEERRQYLKKIAENTLARKRKRISIAVAENDLARLKAEALRTGIPYQTIINSLIRKHVRPQ